MAVASRWPFFASEEEILFRTQTTSTLGLDKCSRRFRLASEQPRVVLVVAGTRPECIKLATVIRELGRREGLRAVVVNSGQHAARVRETLAGFDIRCDVELTPLPSLANLAASCRNLEARLQQLIEQIQPAVVLVQGDTLTAYAAARAG